MKEREELRKSRLWATLTTVVDWPFVRVVPSTDFWADACGRPREFEDEAILSSTRVLVEVEVEAAGATPSLNPGAVQTMCPYNGRLLLSLLRPSSRSMRKPGDNDLRRIIGRGALASSSSNLGCSCRVEGCRRIGFPLSVKKAGQCMEGEMPYPDAYFSAMLM